MRTTLTLDDDVYQAAQHLARASGQRLGRIVSDLMRQGLRPVKPGKAGRKVSYVFPVVEVPPGTPLIPASRVQKFLDEEGHF